MEDYDVQPAQPSPAPRRGSRWLLVGGVVLALTLTLGVGALVGAVFGGQAQAASATNQSQAVNAATGQPDAAHRGLAGTPGPGGQGQCVTLTVTSVNGSTIVAKAADGNSVTITTTSSTTYTKNHQSADASAVTVGSRISVMGTHNSDGSITATSIDVLG